MSYNGSVGYLYHQAAPIPGAFSGEKPTDLSVRQPTIFEPVINLKNAKALGVTILETLLAITDEVIQYASRVVSCGERRPTA